jgi:[lysine-biosynthesis-protein LysW]---L-2-aminoadipate ligase
MRLAVVSTSPTATTKALAATCLPGVEIVPMTPPEAALTLAPGDAALGRLDVRGTLDGIEDGLWALGVLAARGVTVLNGPATLIATHDKLVTARVLRRAGLPHPWTRHIRPGRPVEDVYAPVVVKPRHGSWGRNVVVCETDESLATALEALRAERWYVEHGALVQELVPPTGSDLRVVVAGDRVVGAVRREAAPGEWRTNVALGARRVPVDPPPEAALLALAAARATSAALVGVDLLPTPDGGCTILELNGAVDFTGEYRPGDDIFQEAATELCRFAREEQLIQAASSEDPLRCDARRRAQVTPAR